MTKLSDSDNAAGCCDAPCATKPTERTSKTAKVALDDCSNAPPAHASHPLDPLSRAEVRSAAAAALSAVPAPETSSKPPRFSYITLQEPDKSDVAAWKASCTSAAGAAVTSGHNNDLEVQNGTTGDVKPPPRIAEAVLILPDTGLAYQVLVELGDTTDTGSGKGTVKECVELPRGTQPCFTPDDCFLAEDIVKADPRFQELMREHYAITDLSLIACDPWSVHLAAPEEYAPLKWRQSLNGADSASATPPRLVQTFLYMREDEEDNHYAHPIPLLPVVDLNADKVVALQGEDDKELLARPIPSARVNYHRNKLSTNSYLPIKFRSDVPKPLDITQPQGPSFTVHGRNLVTWQKWSFRVGFNYREALVLYDVCYDGRSVLDRASLVEMTVPYVDPRPPFQSKNAGDVGDYGLGYCATSLELCADCNGDITYFDAVLADSKGEPYNVHKAVCMHEEDGGVLWKHVEYRNGMAETRRARNLVLQSSYTVVNYEYLSYVTFGLDGSISFDLKLTGELSTNLPSVAEAAAETPDFGTIVAPGVNAQLHQHQFCYRLDVSIDGPCNRVVETTLKPLPISPTRNPYGNAIQKVSTVLKTESGAKRPQPPPGSSWRIENASGAKNTVNGQPTAYKLMPNTRGAPQPLLLPAPESAVCLRGAFACAALWVTPYSAKERFPAGEFPTQSIVEKGQLPSDGLAKWTAEDRNVDAQDIVLWHSFGVTHIPRVEDFPVMPVEVTGFMLKPDGFFSGNPAVDLPPEYAGPSKQCCIPAA